MTAPDSRAPFIQRCYTCGRESPHGPLLHYPGCEVGATTHAVAGFAGEAALARGPQQAGGEDVIRGLAGIAHSHRHLSAAPIKAIELITALQAEVARLTREASNRHAQVIESDAMCADHRDRAETAEAALREAGRDAGRYRWLRDKAPDTWDVSRWLDKDTQEIHLQDDLDAAIDAALNGGQDDA